MLIFLGFGGMGFKQGQQVPLKAGEDVKIGRYTLRNTSVKVSDDGQKQMVTAYLAVFADGKQIDTLYPAKWFFRKHEQEPTTEVAIRRSFAEDLYVTSVVTKWGRRSQISRSTSTRWSTGCGWALASWRSAPASRCCRSAVLVRAGADAD